MSILKVCVDGLSKDDRLQIGDRQTDIWTDDR